MHYINISDLVDRDWRFLEPVCTAPALSWDMRYGRPQNRLERLITRPAVARYRACLSAVWSARRRSDAVLVSHLPNVTLATAGLARRIAPGRPHVAFAFNYTHLPEGRRLALSQRYFQDVTEFVVFSRQEVGLYADLFDLPPSRFTFLPWAMQAPEVAFHHPPPFEGAYLSAIGGEGRDYHVLAEAMRAAPELQLAIVARPASIEGICFPENVKVFTNLPGPVTWAIAQKSCGMAIPLRTDRTPNGHVTLVGAQLLGVPLAVTRSAGVADYVDSETALLVSPQDTREMADALRALTEDTEAAQTRAALAQKRAGLRSNVAVWLRYFTELDLRLSDGPM